MLSDPTVPDRTAYILGESSENPLQKLVEGAHFLEAAGCENIAIACVTAHYFAAEIEAELSSAKLLNMIELTADRLAQEGMKIAGLTATDGTVQSGIFQRALESKGVECILPYAKEQKAIMREIYDVIKAGRLSDGLVLSEAAERLASHGAECMVIGCTELSFGSSMIHAGGSIPIYDSLEILAEEAVRVSR
jgi:aspartate racemase